MTTLEELAKEAATCTRCDLYQRATATVFGEGRPHSPLALVGEQPGDQEDKQGRPFVGPAGHILDRALRESGIERADVLRHERGKALQMGAPRGKRRIHQRPNGTEIMACHGWLEAELAGSSPGSPWRWARWLDRRFSAAGSRSAIIAAAWKRSPWANGRARCSAPSTPPRSSEPATTKPARKPSQARR